MATIGDVARRAGVSRTAVSFAFNKPDQLAEDTLKRILDVAHDLGYYPNPAARSLNTGRTGIIGVLIPQRAAIVCSNPFILEFLKGLGHVTDRQGLAILLVPPVRGSLTNAMNNVPVDGFVTLGLGKLQREVHLLYRRKIPFVVVDAAAPDGVSSVVVDEESGATEAAAFLLDRGHRDVLIVAMHAPHGDDDDLSGTAQDTMHRRLRAYAAAFEARGVPPPAAPRRVVVTESTVEAGARALRGVLNAGPPPTAVLAMSDALAFGVMRQARAAGLRVPDDLSVIGFDDVAGSAVTSPALTTIRQPIAEKGQRAAELLVAHLDGTATPARLVLPVSLVVRESVAVKND